MLSSGQGAEQSQPFYMDVGPVFVALNQSAVVSLQDMPSFLCFTVHHLVLVH